MAPLPAASRPGREQLLRRYEQLGTEIRTLITEAPKGVIDEERQSQIDELKASAEAASTSILNRRFHTTVNGVERMPLDLPDAAFLEPHGEAPILFAVG